MMHGLLEKRLACILKHTGFGISYTGTHQILFLAVVVCRGIVSFETAVDVNKAHIYCSSNSQYLKKKKGFTIVLSVRKSI